MIDCNITKNYFSEKARMTKKTKVCGIKCDKCPLSGKNNGAPKFMTYTTIETHCPEQAILIVQRWSNAHPPKTYLTELLKIFPNTPLNDDGTPKGICLHELGATSLDNCEVDNACVKCWNRLIPEDGEK